MTDHDPAHTWVCYGCVGDEYLVDEIKSDGTSRKCSFCSKRRKCYSLSDIGERVHPIYLERYHPSDDYDRGETPLFCIAEIIGSDDDPVARALLDYLSDTHGGWPPDGDVNPYDDSYNYLETRSDGRQYARKWRELAQSLRHESRYFNRKAQTILDEIFDGLNFGLNKPKTPQLETFFQHRSVVTIVSPGDEQAVLYRAREARDESIVSRYLRDPASQLSAPPPNVARAGRMNPTGISLFYGSFDPDTCIAEIRPPVGTYAVIARFDIIRQIRLLDFRKLTEAFEPISHFHPQYTAKRDRDAFLKAFSMEISIPVHPQDENLGYLPTQAVAEYLAQRADLKVDGIIFRSTQSGNEGMNIVLFQRAARVEPPTHSFEPEWYQPYEDLPEITVVATPIPSPEAPPVKPSSAEIPSIFDIAEQMPLDEPTETPPPLPPPTLRLNPNGFRVESIGTITYRHAGLKVEYMNSADKAAKEKELENSPF